MENKKKILIVGAGISGLTLGYKLSESGHDVVILEKENNVGGLAKSFVYDGFIFDIGPHRFFTHVKEVENFIKKILKGNFNYVQRDCAIYFQEKYYTWPLAFTELFRLPKTLLLKCWTDLLLTVFSSRSGKDLESFSRARFGRTLYNIFFKDFNEKVTGMPCNRIDRKWLQSGIEKVMIDKRLQLRTLSDLLRPRNIFSARRLNFIYPNGGIKLFSDKLAEQIQNKGGRIITNAGSIALELNNNKVVSAGFSGENMPVDWLIWTGPLEELSRLVNVDAPKLRYIDLIIYNIRTKRPINTKRQWVYFGEKDFVFSRVSYPQNFWPNNVPYGKGSLCVEVPISNEISKINLTALQKDIIQGLEKSNVCRSDDILGIQTEVILQAYPLYELNYQDELDRFKLKIASVKNLKCLGRLACFSYNNMDDSIMSSLEAGRDILNGDSSGY